MGGRVAAATVVGVGNWGARCALAYARRRDGMPVPDAAKGTQRTGILHRCPPQEGADGPSLQWVELDGESQESSLQAGFESDAEAAAMLSASEDAIVAAVASIHDAVLGTGTENSLTDAGWGLAQGQGPQRVCYTVILADWTERGAGIAVLRLAEALRHRPAGVEHRRIVIGTADDPTGGIDQVGRARAALRLLECDALSHPEVEGGALFDVSFLLSRRPGGISLEPWQEEHAAATLIELCAFGHAILMRQTGNPLYPPSQPGCPTPPIHSSLGVVEVVLPRAELARFATARALLESMRFGPLGPISVPDTELARWARGAVEGLLSGEGLSLQPKLFADGVRDVVCRDELGNPLDEADPWEVATDSDPPDTWARALMDYEVLLTGAQHRYIDVMRANGTALSKRVRGGLLELVDQALVGEGGSRAKALLSRCSDDVHKLCDEVKRALEEIRAPDTRGAIEKLRKAIARVPRPGALVPRMGLMALPLALGAREAIQESRWPQLSWAGPAAAAALALVSYCSLWAGRRRAVRLARNEARAVIEEKVRRGARRLALKQAVRVVEELIAEIAAETVHVESLERGLIGLEYRLWRQDVVDIVGEKTARGIAEQLPEQRWERSAILTEDVARWQAGQIDEGLPAWMVRFPGICVLEQGDFERCFRKYAQEQPRDWWGHIVDGGRLLAGWREWPEYVGGQAYDPLETRLAEGARKFSWMETLAEVRLDTVLADLSIDCDALWRDRVSERLQLPVRVGLDAYAGSGQLVGVVPIRAVLSPGVEATRATGDDAPGPLEVEGASTRPLGKQGLAEEDSPGLPGAAHRQGSGKAQPWQALPCWSGACAYVCEGYPGLPRGAFIELWPALRQGLCTVYPEGIGDADPNGLLADADLAQIQAEWELEGGAGLTCFNGTP